MTPTRKAQIKWRYKRSLATHIKRLLYLYDHPPVALNAKDRQQINAILKPIEEVCDAN